VKVCVCLDIFKIFVGNEHLKQFLNDVTSKGGEGIILRESLSKYEPKSLRVLKSYLEANVIVMSNSIRGLKCKQ
jgi:hypothetical protein